MQNVHYKGTTTKIVVELDDSDLVENGLGSVDLTGATIKTEFEDDSGTQVEFGSGQHTIDSAKVYSITPTVILSNSLAIGRHLLRSHITLASSDVLVVEKAEALLVKPGYQSS